jgi:hypothetical protein
MLVGVAVSVADDPSIGLRLRSQIWETTDDYMVTQMGVIHLYDPVENRVLLLENRKPHEGITRKGNFFVRCVDFVDQYGRKIDVDLLVPQTGKPMQVTQAIVHKINGMERQINLLVSGTSM